MVMLANIKLSAKEKKYFLILINVLIGYASLAFVFIIPAANSYGPSYRHLIYESTIFIFIVITYFFFIPIYGRLKGKIKKVKLVIFTIFFIKVFIIVIMDAFNYWTGENNFNIDYNYALDYLNGRPTLVYYPPLNTLYFIFLVLTNPWRNHLLFRLSNFSFELGIYYMLYKISNIKNLNINKTALLNAIFYFTFSIEEIDVILL
ncbi:MAG: hypothetical protein ACTSRA_16455, partial [Promethearchaeota archaeon]